jgi:hypothetical protein
MSIILYKICGYSKESIQHIASFDNQHKFSPNFHPCQALFWSLSPQIVIENYTSDGSQTLRKSDEHSVPIRPVEEERGTECPSVTLNVLPWRSHLARL